MQFCITCGNLLLVFADAEGDNNLRCQTCPYQAGILPGESYRVPLSRKKVDDVMGGEEAWSNAATTDASKVRFALICARPPGKSQTGFLLAVERAPSANCVALRGRKTDERDARLPSVPSASTTLRITSRSRSALPMSRCRPSSAAPTSSASTDGGRTEHGHAVHAAAALVPSPPPSAAGQGAGRQEDDDKLLCIPTRRADVFRPLVAGRTGRAPAGRARAHGCSRNGLLRKSPGSRQGRGEAGGGEEEGRQEEVVVGREEVGQVGTCLARRPSSHRKNRLPRRPSRAGAPWLCRAADGQQRHGSRETVLCCPLGAAHRRVTDALDPRLHRCSSIAPAHPAPRRAQASPDDVKVEEKKGSSKSGGGGRGLYGLDKVWLWRDCCARLVCRGEGVRRGAHFAMF